MRPLPLKQACSSYTTEHTLGTISTRASSCYSSLLSSSSFPFFSFLFSPFLFPPFNLFLFFSFCPSIGNHIKKMPKMTSLWVLVLVPGQPGCVRAILIVRLTQASPVLQSELGSLGGETVQKMSLPPPLMCGQATVQVPQPAPPPCLVMGLGGDPHPQGCYWLHGGVLTN